MLLQGLLVVTLIKAVKLRIVVEEPQLLSNTQEQYLKNLLVRYEKFSFTLHIDDENREYANIILKYIQQFQIWSVFNHNNDDIHSFCNLPPFKGTIHLILLKDFLHMQHHECTAALLNGKDILLLMLFKEYDMKDVEHYLLSNITKHVGNFLVLDLHDKEYSLLNKTCYYCGIYNGSIIPLEKTSSPTFNVQNMSILPKRFNTFYQFEFHVAYINYFPYVYCTDSEFSSTVITNYTVKVCKNAIGWEVDLLEAISHKLNFTYILVNFNDGDNHSLLIDKVRDGIVDFAIGGFSRTVERTAKVGFIVTPGSEWASVMYVLEIPLATRMFAFFFPFKWIVWTSLLISVLFLSLILYANVNFRKRKLLLTFSRCFFGVVNSLYEQLVLIPKRYYKERNLELILTLWWLCCICLTTLYKAKLASILFLPPHKEPHSLEEILDSGYDIVVNALSDGTVKAVYTMPGSINARAMRHTVQVQGRCESLQFALTNGGALFAEYYDLKYNMQIKCPSVIGYNKTVDYDLVSLRVVQEAIVKIPHGWPVGKNVPYADSFKVISRRLLNGGFVVMWRKKIERLWPSLYNIQHAKDNNRVGGGVDAGGLTSYMSAFVIFALGTAVSIICFAVEIISKLHN